MSTSLDELRASGIVADPQTGQLFSKGHYRVARLRALQPQPVERVPLDASAQGEETRWYETARRFEIVFTVYSRRPCDWDGYDIKALQDFLVTAGIIPDDGWATLSGRVLSRKAQTQGEEKTVIEIYACENCAVLT